MPTPHLPARLAASALALALAGCATPEPVEGPALPEHAVAARGELINLRLCPDTGALDDAAFDIADRGNTAPAALRQGAATRLHRINLASGRATPLGRVGDGAAVVGLAIEP